MATKKAASGKAPDPEKMKLAIGKGRPGPGRSEHKPTDQMRNVVMVGRAAGLNVRVIAQQVGVSLETLNKHYKHELEHGKDTILFRASAKVIQKALQGDGRMLVFYLTNHGGDQWQKKSKHEHSGLDGTPLAPPILQVNFVTPDHGEPEIET